MSLVDYSLNITEKTTWLSVERKSRMHIHFSGSGLARDFLSQRFVAGKPAPTAVDAIA